MLFGLTNVPAAIYRKLLKDCKASHPIDSKYKKFEWDDEQKNAFQTQKDMLCDAPILALPEGVDDFVVYCKAKVVANALSRKEWMKPRRVRALSMTIHSIIKARILEAHNEASKDVNTPPEMLRGLDKYKCLTCSKVKAEQQKPSGLHLEPEIPEWKWEKITMDFITKLPRTSSGHDTIWVIVDQLTKSAHFLAIREDYQMERFTRLYINEIIARHGDTTNMIAQIKERLKTARDRQKSYADNRRKPVDFNVGEKVLLKVSPWKGIVRFGKRSKLSPR
ncbi:putative reverse transcriptase domain-containing protein [Tanacetum coccineum]